MVFRGFSVVLALLALLASPAQAGVAPPVAVTGVQKLLVVAVRFPGTDPAATREDIQSKAARVGKYIQIASFGKLRIEPRVVGWYEMPGPLGEYKISPHNYGVDKSRVRKLAADALGAARGDGIDLDTFDQIWIVVGATTRPGQGYGMIAYCANPGMLTGVRRTEIGFERINLSGGGSYAGPVIVSAENAHVGHAAHDLLHALGGAKGGQRVVPDLYDFDLQSNPPAGKPMHPALFAIHAGPLGIMSQHFIQWRAPPPQPLAFTRLQLGWIDSGQVAEVKAGETREVVLSPLATGKATLVARVRLDDERFLLFENRQPIGADQVLPGHGLIVSYIDTTAEEGGGIVKVVDANPSTDALSDAPFKVGGGERRAFVDETAGVAAAPLSVDKDGNMRVVFSTPEKIGDFLP